MCVPLCFFVACLVVRFPVAHHALHEKDAWQSKGIIIRARRRFQNAIVYMRLRFQKFGEALLCWCASVVLTLAQDCSIPQSEGGALRGDAPTVCASRLVCAGNLKMGMCNA